MYIVFLDTLHISTFWQKSSIIDWYSQFLFLLLQQVLILDI